MQSCLFDKAKGWDLEKAKAWFEKHQEGLVKEHISAILPFTVLEKIVDKPLRIRGVAITSGMSRNFNIYTPEELQAFAEKLVSAPVYVEHVAVSNAVGKVTKTEWDGENLWYEAEIYENDVADKIRKGLIQHVSVGADYETLDIVDGQVPHGLHNAELSLVAVPGIPETNIKVLEKLHRLQEQGEFCVFCGQKAPEIWLASCFDCFDELPVSEAKKKALSERRGLSVPPNYAAPVNAPANPQRSINANLAEALLKDKQLSEPMFSATEVVKMIEEELPPLGVERSWGFGPQLMCQRLRARVLRLKEASQSPSVNASSRG